MLKYIEIAMYIEKSRISILWSGEHTLFYLVWFAEWNGTGGDGLAIHPSGILPVPAAEIVGGCR